MKKLIVLMIAATFTLNCMASPSEKVLDKFQTNFPNAKKVSWSEDLRNYVVYFVNGDEQCRIWYSKSGDVVQTIRYYQKNKLHPFILSKVANKFKGLSISNITEVSNDMGTVYEITLEDDTKWYKAKADSYGSVSITDKFDKG